MAVRNSMHEVGGVLPEKLLAADDGYRGHRIDCRKGHLATFVDRHRRHRSAHGRTCDRTHKMRPPTSKLLAFRVLSRAQKHEGE